jgi:hypothetical protein
MVLKPNGYAIWECIRDDLDRRFKATGHRPQSPLWLILGLLINNDNINGI